MPNHVLSKHPLHTISAPTIAGCVLLLMSISAFSDDDIWLSSEQPPASISVEKLSPPDSESAVSTDSDQEVRGEVMTSHRIAGTALRPRNAGVDFQVSSTGGCTYTEDNPSDVFNTPIWLPQGTLVSSMRMYFNDTSASNSVAWFTVYDSYGEIVDEWNVSSTGDDGTGFADTATIDHVINYNDYSYLINWRPNATGSSMQLCGFQILHTPPSPTVHWDRFEQQ